MDMKEQQARIATLCKEIRNLSNSVKIKKLTTLDLGDRHLVIRLLEELRGRLHYLHQLGEARCSEVLELLEYQTNLMREQKDETQRS